MGTVYADLQSPGQFGSGDATLSGLTVQLRGSNGAVFGTVTTGPSGDFYFSDLPTGSYSLDVSGSPLLGAGTAGPFGVSEPGGVGSADVGLGVSVGYSSDSGSGSGSGEYPAGVSASWSGSGSGDSGSGSGDSGSGSESGDSGSGSGSGDSGSGSGDSGSGSGSGSGYSSFSASGFVWNDANGDGLLNNDETGIGDVSVFLLDDTGMPVDNVTTNGDGSYFLVADGSRPEYQVLVLVPTGYGVSPEHASGSGIDGDYDSDIDSYGFSDPFSWTATVDAGLTGGSGSGSSSGSGSGSGSGSTDPLPALTAAAHAAPTTIPGQAVAFDGLAAGGSGSYSYSWNFGDEATSTEQNSSHAYAAAGTYTATLTVTDIGTGTTATATVSVTAAWPALEATATGPAFAIGLNAGGGFSGAASGGSGNYTFSWDFGDGATSVAQSPTHAYAAFGTYTVTLTVTDATTGATTTATVTVTVASPATPGAVAATATVSDPSLAPGEAVSFAGAASGGTGPYTYEWDFGDGSSGIGQNPSHTYAADGTYIATLTVTDTVTGDSATATVELDVQTRVWLEGVPSAIEVGTIGAFYVRRNGDLSQELDIDLNYTGFLETVFRDVNGHDFTAGGQRIRFLPGESSVQVELLPQDGLVEAGVNQIEIALSVAPGFTPQAGPSAEVEIIYAGFSVSVAVEPEGGSGSQGASSTALLAIRADPPAAPPAPQSDALYPGQIKPDATPPFYVLTQLQNPVRNADGTTTGTVTSLTQFGTTNPLDVTSQRLINDILSGRPGTIGNDILNAEFRLKQQSLSADPLSTRNYWSWVAERRFGLVRRQTDGTTVEGNYYFRDSLSDNPKSGVAFKGYTRQNDTGFSLQVTRDYMEYLGYGRFGIMVNSSKAAGFSAGVTGETANGTRFVIAGDRNSIHSGFSQTGSVNFGGMQLPLQFFGGITADLSRGSGTTANVGLLVKIPQIGPSVGGSTLGDATVGVGVGAPPAGALADFFRMQPNSLVPPGATPVTNGIFFGYYQKTK